MTALRRQAGRVLDWAYGGKRVGEFGSNGQLGQGNGLALEGRLPIDFRADAEPGQGDGWARGGGNLNEFRVNPEFIQGMSRALYGEENGKGNPKQ
jgi:hypothetical protein